MSEDKEERVKALTEEQTRLEKMVSAIEKNNAGRVMHPNTREFYKDRVRECKITGLRLKLAQEEEE